MRILELSGDVGSTYVIARHLAAAWEHEGDDVSIIAPVRGRLDPRVILNVFSARPRYDIIHAHLGNAVILGRRLSRLTGIPLLATLHGFQKAKHYKGVKHFTAVSHAVKTHFVAQGIDEAHIEVVHNGFPEAYLSPPPDFQRPEEWRNRIVIGTVGVLSAVKQHNLLMDALAILASQEPRVLLAIAGTGPLEAPLKDKVRALGLEHHVQFLGFQAELYRFYYNLDIYVQASAQEGFCLPVLEAMACGIPVVTTASQGPEEFVTDGKNGYVDKTMSAQGLSRLLLMLMYDEHRRKTIGCQAQHDIDTFRWPLQAGLYKAIMQKLCAIRRV